MESTIKGIVISCSLVFSTYAFGVCPIASSPLTEDFCQSFKAAAQCQCIESGLQESGICSSMDQYYKKMINSFGTLQRICALKRSTTNQECIDGWNCYRYGGLTADKQLCSGTGHACD